jgi:hypothetical protein
MSNEIIESTRGHITARIDSRVYRIEGEGLTGPDRAVDYVLFSDTLRLKNAENSEAPDESGLVVDKIVKLLTEKGLRVEIE